MGTKNNPGIFDCYDKAKPDEPIFVLLGRDPQAAHLVSIWAKLRHGDKEAAARVFAHLLATVPDYPRLGPQGSMDMAKSSEATSCFLAMFDYQKTIRR